jgi:hypothetical protein
MLRGNSHKRSFTSSHLDSDLFVENFSHSDALFRIAFGNWHWRNLHCVLIPKVKNLVAEWNIICVPVESDWCCVRNAFGQTETEIRRCKRAGCDGAQNKE